MKRLVIVVLALAVIGAVKGNVLDGGQCKFKKGLMPRPHSVSILEFGAVGDGVTLNTIAFQNAVFYLRSFADKGGAQLYVPKGKWLTGSFNLTSHLTLFLDKDAVILGTQEASQWPIVDPLPSYGQGVDLPGARHGSLINGHYLTDVVITGDNGTIDGQGSVWWGWFSSRTLNYSRPHLVELLGSSGIVISNLTLLNSPGWSIHPVYCRDIEIQNITINSPSDSPFTNGIVPDSCSEICIEDCSISVGHDAIALKSGWDDYGISYGKPSFSIHILNVDLQTAFGSALAFGSEMSGGIYGIYAEHLHVHDSLTGITFKTTQGRGGYMENIVVSDMKMENVKTAILFTGHCGSHPGDHYHVDALPVVRKITLKDVVGTDISIAGALSGIDHDPFTTICLSNITLSGLGDRPPSWSCSDVSGYSESVTPPPCSDLALPFSNSSNLCFSLHRYNPLASSA